MRHAWRTVAVLAAFVVVGYVVMHLGITHAVQMGTPDPELRLAGGMAGLFAGGAAACLVGIATLVGKRPQA